MSITINVFRIFSVTLLIILSKVYVEVYMVIRLIREVCVGQINL